MLAATTIHADTNFVPEDTSGGANMDGTKSDMAGSNGMGEMKDMPRLMFSYRYMQMNMAGTLYFSNMYSVSFSRLSLLCRGCSVNKIGVSRG